MLIIGQIQKILDTCINYATKSITIWSNTSKDGTGSSYTPIVNSAGQLIVQTSSVSGTSDVNLKQIGGAGVAVGSWPCTSSLSVVLATDRPLMAMDMTTVMSSQVVNPSSTYTATAITITYQRAFSIEYDITTTGTRNVSFAYTASNAGSNFYTPDAGGDITTALASGIASFAPPPCKYLKITATNLDTSNATINVFMATDKM